MRTLHIRFPSGYQPSLSPAEWHVTTIGHGADASANGESTGASGSWTCTTSKRSFSQIRRIRSIDCGLRMRFGRDAFAGTITDRPTGSTYSGGRVWRPCFGWSNQVSRPGGSCPMTRRASWPSRRNARAWWSACSWTPPQNDQEYGTTIPTFTLQPYPSRLIRLGA